MNTSLLLGSALLLLGAATLVFAAFRAMSHAWSFGLYEFWVLPVAGVGMVLLGRLVLR